MFFTTRNCKLCNKQVSKEEVIPYLKIYGAGPLSYSVLQSGMSYFLIPNKGAIAFKEILNRRFVLADPLCAIENIHELVYEFNNESKKLKKRPVYCQISEKVARSCEAEGFYINSLGVENIIDPQNFQVTWKKRKGLKRYCSKLYNSAEKITIKELPDSKIDYAQLKIISKEWLKKKAGKKELQFMARPMVYDYEQDVRRFYGFRDQVLVAFCTFDPCYKNNDVYAYSLNNLRINHEAPSGILDYIIVTAINTFKNEGQHTFHLGLSPLYNLDLFLSNAQKEIIENTVEKALHAAQQEIKIDDIMISIAEKNIHNYISNLAKASFSKEAKTTNFIIKFLYRYTNFLYSFKNLGLHKDRYKPFKRQTYVASMKASTWFDILLLLKLNNVF